jgi:hypothetical protein
MYILKKRFSDSLYLTGIICIIISLLFFCLPLISTEESHGLFLVNFGLQCYVFEQVQQEKIRGGNIYTGTLVKANDKLYSAWWYSDGETITTDQWTWRWDMIKGRQPYAVINITCSQKEELDREIKKVTDNKLLADFFSNSVYQ